MSVSVLTKHLELLTFL